MDTQQNGNRMESLDMIVTKVKMVKAMLLMAFWIGVAFQMDAQKSPLLWEVKSIETGAVSYIFGTYHLVGADYLEENVAVKEAYEQSKVVVVEMVVDSSAMMMVAMKAMMLDNSLKNLVDSVDYMMLKTELEGVLGIPIEQLSNLKPVMVSTMYSMAKAQQVTPAEYSYGGTPIDLFFAEDGKKQGKQVIALETAMEQAEVLFDSQSLEAQAQALVENVKAEVEDDLSNEILEAYMAQDLGALWKLNEEWDESLGEMAILLDERNQKWVPKLKPLFDKGAVFVAVGAWHLPGEQGVLKLLEKEGYKVKGVVKRD